MPGAAFTDLFLLLVDYNTFLTILNRPDGFKPPGSAGALSRYVGLLVT